MGSITRSLRHSDRRDGRRTDRSRVGPMTAAVLLAAFTVPRLALACAVGITNA
jgi:hypothetical protein